MVNNENKTVLIKPEDGYLANALFEDDKLNLFHIGLLYYILSQGDGFVVVKEQIREKSQLGVYKFNIEWDFLVEAGYIKKNRIQRGVEWIVSYRSLK